MASVDEYLRHLGIDKAREPDLAFLRELHAKHLCKVPFENIDIRFGVPITIDEAAFIDKILKRNRGGFCYELNGAFAWLLEQLGYRVSRLSARVSRFTGGFGPEFDHLTLLVHLDEGDQLADVGFGTSSLYPVPLNGTPVENTIRPYRVYAMEDGTYSYQSFEGDQWKDQYYFSLTSYPLLAFGEMCSYHQENPESPFVRGTILVTKATPFGRIWVRGDKFIETRATGDTEREIDIAERNRLLQEHFAIELTDQ
jgi:N-hydroxyarylamine O-acetyltransferase